MAQIIRFDDGFKEYQINNSGVLRLNPSDPNMYQRFFDAQEKLLVIEEELVQQGKQLQPLLENATLEQKMKASEANIRLMTEADRKAKEVLAWVFPGNDFDVLLGGANTMAVGMNGERVITNLLNALVPIVEEGVQTYTNAKVNQAVAQAGVNRAQRRARKHRKGGHR